MTYTLNYLRFMWHENVGNPKPINICFSRLVFRLTSSLSTLLFLVRTGFVRTVTLRLSKVKNNLRTTPGWMQVIKKYSDKIRQTFEREILKHKYIHSILQQNNFHTINIFRTSRKFNIFAPKCGSRIL